MTLLVNISLLLMMLTLAFVAIRMRDLFAVVMIFGIYSLFSAALFVILDAADVAFTEAAVGAGVSTILLLSALSQTKRYERKPSHKPLLPALVVLVVVGTLVYGTMDTPDFGDPNAPVHTHMAPRFIEESPEEIGIPNMVTSVLASYRGFDTLGEVVVVFTAGLGVMLLLGGRRKRGGEHGE